jgi:ferredoxin
MKVRIDRERCTGHGRCYAVAPDVFDTDDDGFGVVLELGPELSAELLVNARLAAATCPEDAIGLEA